MTRFVNTSDAEIEELLEGRNSKNTSNVISMAVKIIRDYLEDMAINISVDDLENDSNEKLNIVLRKFCAELRKKNGELYSKSSLISIRYGLQRHFLKLKGVDIINNQEFKSTNDVFKACLVKVKREGKRETKHKDVISEEDREKMYSTGVLSRSDPSTLQNNFFSNSCFSSATEAVKMYERWRKTTSRSALMPRVNVLSSKTFRDSQRTTEGTRQTAMISRRECMKSREMRGVPSIVLRNTWPNYTPIRSEKKPREGFEEEDSVWFCNVPVGKNTLGNMMQKNQ